MIGGLRSTDGIGAFYHPRRWWRRPPITSSVGQRAGRGLAYGTSAALAVSVFIGQTAGIGSATGIGAASAASNVQKAGRGAATGTSLVHAASFSQRLGAGSAIGIGAAHAASDLNGERIGTGSATGTGAALAMSPMGCIFPGIVTRLGVAENVLGGPLDPIYGATADPTVIYTGGQYVMYYTAYDGEHTGIARATSPDGLVWTVWNAPELVLFAPPGGWDEPGLETANVVIGPDDIWRMYYTGNRPPEGSAYYSIGMATSSDGITWTRAADPVLEPQEPWEQPLLVDGNLVYGGVLEPSVLYEDGIYKMWYVGVGEPPDSFRAFRVGYATSLDGVTWTRLPDPVFDVGTLGSWDEASVSHVNVVADYANGGYHMFYAARSSADTIEGAAMQHSWIGHAFSEDGIVWERDPANPVISPRPGDIDAWHVGGPSARVTGAKIQIWFHGGETGGVAIEIQMAEATCP